MKTLSRVPSLKEPLGGQVQSLTADLVKLLPRFSPPVDCAILVGSASRGEATYRSDLDLWIFLDVPPTFAQVSEWRREVETALSAASKSPLPLQIQFLATESLNSKDEAIQKAIFDGIRLYSLSKRSAR